jgi:hypothetical protein
MIRRLPLVLVLACARSAVPAAPAAPVYATEARPVEAASAACAVPPGWDVAVMAREVFDFAIQEGNILAWKIEEDDRPLRIESAIILIRHIPAGSSAGLALGWPFILAHVYRHPQDDNRWHVAMVTDVAYTGMTQFVEQPTAAQLATFLEDTWWTFGARDQDYRLLGAGVCGEAWRALFGVEPPTR